MMLTQEKAITRTLSLHLTGCLGSLRTAGFTNAVVTIHCKIIILLILH